MRRVSFLMVLLFLTASAVMAQNPVKVDSKHYKVVLENAQVRVLRISYEPGEKSVMHDRPNGVAVFLTDHTVKFTFPDGKTEERRAKAGESIWNKAPKHLPENTTAKRWELILVELKTK